MVNVRDITAQLEAERALRESEEYSLNLVENSLDIIMLLGRDLRTSFINPGVKKGLGYRPEELQGRSIMELVAPVGIILASSGLSHVLEGTDGDYDGEFTLLRRDGSRRMAQLKATRRLDSPSIGGILVNVHDVTELRSAERRLREMVRVFQALVPDVVANMETVIRGAKNILGAPLTAYCRLVAGRFSVLTTAPGEHGFRVTCGGGITLPIPWWPVAGPSPSWSRILEPTRGWPAVP